VVGGAVRGGVLVQGVGHRRPGAGRGGAAGAGAVSRDVLLLPVAAIYLAARTAVLRGRGGSGDAAAPVAAKLLQIASGLVHAVTGAQILAEPVAWTVGLAVWVGLLFGVARAVVSAPRSWAPCLWIAVAVAPLLAAPWIVGARYFYLAAAGLAWLAAEGLQRRSAPIVVGVLSCLAGLGLAQDLARRQQISTYNDRLSAARRAVAAGLSEGFTTFQISAGIKDLDLAVKEDRRFSAAEPRLVVLGDVPASFVALPEGRAPELDFLLARPPLPPAGAYRFGHRRIAGLARRGDDPTLDELASRLPDIRFIRLYQEGEGHVTYRDVTDTLLRESRESDSE